MGKKRVMHVLLTVAGDARAVCARGVPSASIAPP